MAFNYDWQQAAYLHPNQHCQFGAVVNFFLCDRISCDNRYYEAIDGKTADITDEIPFDLPDGWAWCRQQSIITLISGQDFSPDGYNDSRLGIPYITGASNMLNGSIIVNRWTEHPSSIAVAGDILITCKGAGVGKMAYMDIPQAHVARQIMAIRPHCNIPSKFIEVVLQGQFITIREQMNGLIPGISRDVMLNLLFPLPPLAEQQRIVEQIEMLLGYVDIIDTDAETLEKSITLAKQKILDLAIRGKLVPQDPTDEPASELLKKIKAEKDALVKAGKIKKDKHESFIFKGDDNCYYEQLDGKTVDITEEIPFDLPESWSWCRLNNIGSWGAGATPSRNNKEYYQDGAIPWLKTGDLNNGDIYSVPEYITEKALQETSVQLNPAGSVLIAMYGATIGKVGILQIAATTNQACCACSVFNGIDNRYLFFFLLSQKENFKILGGGGAQPNISKDKIINYLFPLPPLAGQKKIVARITQYETILKSIQE